MKVKAHRDIVRPNQEIFLLPAPTLLDELQEYLRMLRKLELAGRSDALSKELQLGRFAELCRGDVSQWSQLIRAKAVDRWVRGDMLSNLGTVTKAYLETALWAETDDEDDPLEQDYSLDYFSEAAAEQAQNDCNQLMHRYGTEIMGAKLKKPYNKRVARLRLVGKHFWLTRRGHGAGFWDGDWPEDLGDKLTAYCHTLPHRYPQVDNNVIELV